MILPCKQFEDAHNQVHSLGNYPEERKSIIQEAIKLSGFNDMWIEPATYRGEPRVGYISVIASKSTNRSRFWRIYEQLKNEI